MAQQVAVLQKTSKLHGNTTLLVCKTHLDHCFFPLVLQVVAYGIARPARELLFTVVSRDQKYRAKVFVLGRR
jgi:hypothetical protein